MQKVLIITYYWPPSGGVGVQRWLKHAKYLPENGWEPVVLTPENPAFDLQDTSLERDVRSETEVLKIPIWEPYKLVEKFSGKKGQGNLNRGMALEGEKKSFFSILLLWLRGNLLIPDPRVFWVKPATDFALRILKNNDIKAIITTGPPHSIHLIGRALKKKTGLPWIADFRDPWSKWEILHRMKPSSMAMKIHERLERKVLQEADVVLAAAPGLRELLEDSGARNARTLLNGVDEAELPPGYPDVSSPDKFRIVHVGLMNEKKNPKVLWEVLQEMVQEDEQLAHDLEISLTGSTSLAVYDSLTACKELQGKYSIDPYVNHSEVFNIYKKAAVLLLVLDLEVASRVVIHAKLYEYLTAQRPVLYIGNPKSGSGEIIQKEKAGQSFHPSQRKALKQYLQELYSRYKKGTIAQPVNYQAYLRKNQAGVVAKMLNELVEGP